MTPFFFGDSSRPLFGVYHPARGPRARPWGIVICNPFGQEYLRAHRALRQLANRLSERGFHTLRFDYYGCGDSAGETGEGSPSQWLDDIAAATEEARELAATRRAALVGLRLGATLAVLHARRVRDVDALVAWDAIVDGPSYVRELLDTHSRWIADHAHADPAAQAREPPQALGFPVSALLRRELEGIDLSRPEEPVPRRALVVTSGARENGAALWGGAGERVRIGGTQVWLRGDGLDDSMVPVEPLAAITTWLAGACS